MVPTAVSVVLLSLCSFDGILLDSENIRQRAFQTEAIRLEEAATALPELRIGRTSGRQASRRGKWGKVAIRDTIALPTAMSLT